MFKSTTFPLVNLGSYYKITSVINFLTYIPYYTYFYHTIVICHDTIIIAIVIFVVFVPLRDMRFIKKYP